MIRDKVVHYTFNFLSTQTANINNKINDKKDKDFFWDDDWLLGYIMGACVNSLSFFLQRQLDSDQDLKDVDYVFGAMLTSLHFYDKEKLDNKYEKKYEEFCKKLDSISIFFLLLLNLSYWSIASFFVNKLIMIIYY